MGKQHRSKIARTTPNHKIVLRLLCGVCSSGNGSKVLIVCEVPFSDPLENPSSWLRMFLSLSLDIVGHDICEALQYWPNVGEKLQYKIRKTSFMSTNE